MVYTSTSLNIVGVETGTKVERSKVAIKTTKTTIDGEQAIKIECPKSPLSDKTVSICSLIPIADRTNLVTSLTQSVSVINKVPKEDSSEKMYDGKTLKTTAIAKNKKWILQVDFFNKDGDPNGTFELVKSDVEMFIGRIRALR
jgi:hypothetical protein